MGWHLSQNPEDSAIPLVCALDGGLLKTDFRSERFVNQTRRTLDALLSSKLDIVRLQLEKNDQPTGGMSLPVDEQIYDFLLEQKTQGRKLILLCRQSVDEVAEMLGEKNIFDQIIRAGSTKDIQAQLGAKSIS